jgi:hypothetical protein
MLSSENEYSDAEKKMFVELGYDKSLFDYIDPVGLYRMAVTKCFLNNLSGPAVEALRRGGNAVLEYRPRVYRMTAEFDKLVEF